LSTRGKVVLVPFPFDDLSASKVRPAVCLTEPVGAHRHVVVAFVTSVVPPAAPQPTDVLLNPDGRAEESGLKRTSVLRLHRLMTVSTSVVRRELGSLSPALHSEVSAKLGRLFGL
jgi:mRNA interferase MazF